MTDFALSSAIVLALLLLGRAIGQVITTGNPRRFLLSFTDTHLVYALPFFVVLAIAVQFVLRTNRMIGTSVLRYFVAGTYHRPRTEERVFCSSIWRAPRSWPSASAVRRTSTCSAASSTT